MPEADGKINGAEWMGDREAHYGSALRSASLVVEANYTREDVDTILRALGSLHRFYARRGDPPERAFARYPNCLLVGMVGTAAIAPEAKTFWPEFWQSTGVEPLADLQRFVGDAFLQALSRNRLPLYTDVVAHRRFVGPAAMHAAIPTSGMGRVIDVVLARRRADPALAGAGLLSWLLSSDGRLSHVDTTVGRFLQHGGELAVDVLDRIIEVVAHVGEMPSALDDGSLSTDTTGLPSVMLAALVAGLQDRRDEVAVQPAVANRARAQAEPTLGLDISAGALVLRLPAVSADSGSALWSVSADGETEDFSADAQWIGRSATTAPRTALLRRPARIVNVRLRGAECLDVQLVNPADPLLLFDLDGGFLPPRVPLPRGELWAVLPSDQEVTDSHGAPIRVLGDLGQPVGWAGWTIQSLDLQSTEAIRLSGSVNSTQSRIVRSSGAPAIQVPTPISAVTTRRGLSVLSQRPKIVVPSRSDAAQWQVEVVRTSGGRRTTWRSSLADCPEVEGGRDPFIAFEAPLLGDFFISVRGAFGKRAQRVVSLAEGLGVAVDPQLRWPTAGQLAAASATITHHEVMSTSSSHLEFDADTLQHELSCQVGHVTEALVVAPPTVQMCLTSGDSAGGWTSSPPILHAEMLEGQASLEVRLPGDSDHYRLQFTADGGGDRQSVEPTARRGRDNRLYELSRFADTARRSGVGRFELLAEHRAFTVARLRPRRFASSGTLVADGLQLNDFRHVEGLQAAVYRATAPWVPPTTLNVSRSGLIHLPGDLRDSGPVLIELAVVDPWAPTDWPDWPAAEAVACPLPGHHRDENGETELLSRALAGESVPEGVIVTDLAAAWPVLELEGRLGLSIDSGRQVRRLVLDSLHRDPAAALASLMLQVRGRASAVRLLIRSELVERRFDSVPSVPLRRGWASAPVLAALGALPLVLSGLEGQEAEDLHQALQLHGGASLLSILESGRDGDREVGGFGSSARAMDQLPAARVAELWSAAQVVPEGLLHPDSRMAAAKQLFDVRRTKELAPVLSFIERDIGRLRRTLLEVAPGVVTAQLDARLDKAPPSAWGLLPAASFAWAAMARLRAHDTTLVPAAGGGRREAWFQLARHAPDYVGMDIVLADVLLQSARPSIEKRSQHE